MLKDLAGFDNLAQDLACVDKQRTSVPRTIEIITIGDSPEMELPKLALVDIRRKRGFWMTSCQPQRTSYRCSHKQE